MLILKPLKTKKVQKTVYIKKSFTPSEFRPSTQEAFASGQYTSNLATINENTGIGGSIPKYELKSSYVQRFAYGKSRGFDLTPTMAKYGFGRSLSKTDLKASIKPISSNIQASRYRQVQIPKVSQMIKQDVTQTTIQKQRISPMLDVGVIQAQDIRQAQDVRQTRIQRTVQRQKYKQFTPLIEVPKIPLLDERFRLKKKEKKSKKTKSFSSSFKFNAKTPKTKLRILPSLRNVFIYEQSGKEAIMPIATKKVKRDFESQLYGRNIFGSPIPVRQKQ